MLNLLRIGTGLAVLLAIVSVNLWLELRSERELTAKLQEQAAEYVNRESGSVPQRIEVRPDVAAPAKTGNPDLSQLKVTATTAAAAAGVNIQNTFSSERDLMKDPEYRKGRLTQLKMNLKRNYTGVAEELGLSASETEQLFDLLAEQQLGPGISIAALAMGPDGQIDRQAMDEARRMQEAAQRQQQDALNALLGPGRQAKWQEYQLSLSARNRAMQMNGMLATSGYPLTEAQLKPLTTALIAEEKYVRQEQATPRPAAQQSAAQRAEESVNRQEESNRRYLETAAPYMSPQQLALVRETLEQQIAIARANARLQRDRPEGGRPF